MATAKVAESAAPAKTDKKDAPATAKSATSNLLFNNTDLFADADDKLNKSKAAAAAKGKAPVTGGIVHIRAQQRNGRKSLTTVQGLATDLDLKKILRALKKTFSTNGTILKDEEGNKVLQLQGDVRYAVKDFLLKTHICEKDDIKVHGF